MDKFRRKERVLQVKWEKGVVRGKVYVPKVEDLTPAKKAASHILNPKGVAMIYVATKSLTRFAVRGPGRSTTAMTRKRRPCRRPAAAVWMTSTARLCRPPPLGISRTSQIS